MISLIDFIFSIFCLPLLTDAGVSRFDAVDVALRTAPIHCFVHAVTNCLSSSSLVIPTLRYSRRRAGVSSLSMLVILLVRLLQGLPLARAPQAKCLSGRFSARGKHGRLFNRGILLVKPRHQIDLSKSGARGG